MMCTKQKTDRINTMSRLYIRCASTTVGVVVASIFFLSFELADDDADDDDDTEGDADVDD